MMMTTTNMPTIIKGLACALLVVLLVVVEEVVIVVATADDTAQESSSSSSSSSLPSSYYYTSFDDASWAITRSTGLSTKLHPDKQRLYDDFMEGCNKRAAAAGEDDDDDGCVADEEKRLDMNLYQPRGMRNFTQTGFMKRRAPTNLMHLLQNYLHQHIDAATVEWADNPTPYHNSWIAPPTMVRLDNTSLTGGGPQLSARIGHVVKQIMQEWTGQQQSVTSVYGIRLYHNQSILTPHVDRLPLVSSCIINVAQDGLTEDWPLEVYDHDGIAHNVTMQPGDMVLYESHSVIHGRPFPLQGNYFANVFIHFEPLGRLIQDEKTNGENEAGTQQQQQQAAYEAEAYKSGLPHYIIPGTEWAQRWWDENPDGWSLLTDIEALIKRGNLETLEYIYHREQQQQQLSSVSILKDPLATHTGWAPIHEAIRDGHLDIVEFLVHTVGVNVNADCFIPHRMTPLALARFYHGVQDEMSQFLQRYGAMEPPECRQVREIRDASRQRQRRALLEEEQERRQEAEENEEEEEARLQQQQQQQQQHDNHAIPSPNLDDGEQESRRRHEAHDETEATRERIYHGDNKEHLRRLEAAAAAARTGKSSEL